MRKLFMLLVILALAAPVFAGGAQEEPDRQITVSVPWAGDEMDHFVPVVEAFEEQHDAQVVLTTQRAEDLVQVLPAQFQAQTSAADVIMMWEWWIAENGEHIMNKNDLWDRYEDDMVAPAVRGEDGNVYGVTTSMNIKPGYFYRQSFFDEHGLSEPDTYDEFLQLLDDIQAIDGVENAIGSGNGVGWPLTDIVEHFIINYGGPELQLGLIEGEVGWVGTEVEEVFRERIIPLLENDYFSDPIDFTEMAERWWDGEYGLYPIGSFITGLVDDPLDIGVFTLPGQRAVVQGPDSFFVPEYASNPDLAMEFVDFVLSEEGQRIRAQEGDRLVPHLGIPNEVYPESIRPMAELVDDMDTLVPDLDDEIGGDWQQTFWDQLRLLWVEPDALDDVLETMDGLPVE